MILVNSVGGCATTMFIDYLEKTVPFSNGQTKFYHINDDGTRDHSREIDIPLLASNLFLVNKDALRWLRYLNLNGKTNQNHPDVKQAGDAAFLKLKHAPHPPSANVKSVPYGVLSFKQGPGGWVEFCQTNDKDIAITKAIYLHADPLDVLSTLFLKKINSGWNATVHDHIIKCSPYPYAQLLKIFEHFSTSWDINDFSNWVHKNQLDPFGIESSFDQWTASGNKEYPALIVKYETMWDNLPAIAKFLDVDIDSFTAGFPKKRERKRPGKDLEQTTFNNLKDLYSTLIEKRSQIPDIFITR